mgnify:CR=1 FL=1
MEKNAETEKGKGRVICPDLVITSSLRVSHAANRFMRIFSAVTGAPILRRGKSNLDEIAYYVKRGGFKSFVVVYSRSDQPSVLKFFRLTDLGYFKVCGYIHIGGITYAYRARPYIGFRLLLDGKNDLSIQIWRFLLDIFGGDTCEEYIGNLCEAKIRDKDGMSVIEFWGKNKLIISMVVKKIAIQK